MQPFLPFGSVKVIDSFVLSRPRIFRTSFLLCVLLLGSVSQVNAQESWTPLTTIDGVEIAYQKADCNGSEMFFIKAKNATDQSVTINLEFVLSAGDKGTANGDLGQLSLGAGAESVGTCEEGLRIDVFQHFTEFDLDYSLEIKKSE